MRSEKQVMAYLVDTMKYVLLGDVTEALSRLARAETLLQRELGAPTIGELADGEA